MTEELSAKTRVIAVVAPGAGNNARYDFNFSDWKPSDNSSLMHFAREFECNINDSELLKSIDELQQIILALFLCDSIPRKIYFFEYGEGTSLENRIKFWRVFGQPRTPDETKQLISSKSFTRLGLFNPVPMIKIDYVAPENEIITWFKFLTENSSISSSLQLIQESFGLAHELYAGLRITDFTTLSTVILLLVSGLENLFTNQADSHADISFKFQTVGAAFYTKYVDEISLKNKNPDTKRKFNYSEFKNILGILYDVRSNIAHGKFDLTFFNDKVRRKRLDKLFSIVGVGEVNKDMKSIYFAHLLLSLGIMENHFLEIFRSAKSNLRDGVKILDKILGDSTGFDEGAENI